MATNKTPPTASIDDYLKKLSPKVKAALQQLRKTIKAAAPQAEEIISYQVPTYKYLGPVVCFAAFPNHCSLFVINKNYLSIFANELKPFKTAGTTIHFTPDNPLPASLVQKIVKARIKENEERTSLKSTQVKAAVKTKETGEVAAYMNKLKHPLKDEIEAVRKIIKGADKTIMERIKWNAPSYYASADMVTFNPRAEDHVHLVFHHPAIVKIKSSLLQGDYKDRRMVYLKNMKEIKANKKELERILKELVKATSK